MSAARDLFDEIIRSGDDAWILRAKEEGRAESHLLDFKAGALGNQGKPNTSGKMETDDRRNLAEAISGFANSDTGGVIVWGVNCRKGSGPDDPDVVQSLVPIENVQRFHTDILSATQEVVSGAKDVDSVLVPCSQNQGRGYVATFVPPHDGSPIMVIYKNANCYFFRSGTSFRKMESWMVADRFGRRPQAKLELEISGNYRISTESTGADVYVVELEFKVRNTGRGMAMYAALGLGIESVCDFWYMQLSPAGGIVARPGNERFPDRNEFPVGHLGAMNRRITRQRGSQPGTREIGASGFFVVPQSDTIYPGTCFTLAMGLVRTDMNAFIDFAPQSGELDGKEPFVKIHYEIHCEGFSVAKVGAEAMSLRYSDLKEAT